MMIFSLHVVIQQVSGMLGQRSEMAIKSANLAERTLPLMYVAAAEILTAAPIISAINFEI